MEQTPTIRVAVVDDDPDIRTAARLALSRHVGEVVIEPRPEAVDPTAFDVVLLDMNLATGARDGRDGLDWLQRLRAADPTVSVVLMTAFGSIGLAVEAMKHGAADFVLKPWQNERLIATVTAAAALAQSRRAGVALESRHRALAASTTSPSGDIVAAAPAMLAALALLKRAAPSGANVLLLGESGTGKGVLARELHRMSARADKPFVTVDLGAVPESLFESELFGHKRGAFTDAKEDRPGRFVAADGGTLFLDEIGNLPPHLQRKLLTVLERQEVIPVGGDQAVRIDVRLITATNLPRLELAREAVFRQDLLYRVNTVEVALPPLRERREDIAALLEHFLALYARKHQQPRRRLTSSVLEALEAYGWPGNVRELQHAVERATILASDDALTVEDFPMLAAPRSATTTDAATLDSMERGAVERALAAHGGNISRAAAALGLTRAALYRRIEKHGL
ncbi:sigma-54-dependent transcriptional regulator [Roseiterribacter gracilis]|uniref:Sigma-54-dependent Fis family transcriptional regulator n=1 Tax=Roseiterribacter gracilis TaxID=2812848 RepID=A0A8S8XFB6_9PROT|nr:sigma-54-dependent Fis family transcriptional regulator [Rhodospirillales bacterium TMPK1]